MRVYASPKMFLNLPFFAPHIGQIQVSGSSSNLVPGAIPCEGSPFAGSYE